MAIADAIEVRLSPEYYVEIETRTYLSDGDESLLVGIPDAVLVSPHSSQQEVISDNTTIAVQPRPQRVIVPVPEEVNKRYLEIRGLATGEIITTIEVLSPKNKRTGEGRKIYEEKRRTVLSNLTHLVEIDLLRGGRTYGSCRQRRNYSLSHSD